MSYEKKFITPSNLEVIILSLTLPLSTLNNSYLLNNYDNLPQGASYSQIRKSCF